MPNFRSIRDLRSDDAPNSRPMPSPNQGQQNQNPNPGMDRMSNRNVMFVGNDPDDNDHGVMPAMNKILAPNFSRHTFIFYLTVVQIIMFIVELVYAGIVYHKPFDENNPQAGPSTCPLLDLGAANIQRVRAGEIYRLITPIFLHGGILHIFSNLIFQTIRGYRYEDCWGSGHMAYIYFLTGIGASLLSGSVSPAAKVSIGASGALFGMLGAQIPYLLMNWNTYYVPVSQQGQESQGPTPACMEMCWVVMIIFFNFTGSMASSSMSQSGVAETPIDNWAHGGGLISGILVGFAFIAKAEGPVSWLPSVKRMKFIFLFLTLVYYGVTLYYVFFHDFGTLINFYDPGHCPAQRFI